MKRLLCSLMVLLLAAPMVAAQETPTPSDWTTEQRCITAPSTPPQGWTYDGVIFTFDGSIHARRVDVATPYDIAYDPEGFSETGSFSPDGHWFAALAGHILPDGGVMNFEFGVEEIRIYSTTPDQILYSVPFYTWDTGIRPAYTVLSVRWLDNENIVITGSLSKADQQHVYSINPFKQTISMLELPDNAIFVSASPDGTRWIYYRYDINARGYEKMQLRSSADSAIVVEVPIEPMFNVFLVPFPQWTADSSKFAAMSYDSGGVSIFDRDGHLVDVFPDDYNARFSFTRDGKKLAIAGYEHTIRIMDLATHTITDTCIETPYSVAFSPDGRELAFGLEPAGYTYILDLAAWQAYRIDLAAADVVGWYPLK